MKMNALALAALIFAVPAYAQDNTPLQVQPASAKPAAVLPANTEVLLRMNQEVTTKGDTWKEGDTFNMSVVHDVMLGDYVVIPKGSRGVGRITWLTSKGAFGKSGKMDIELDYVEVGGRRIDLNGTYRQEGEGNTVATVGGVILAGVFAGFITGKSGRIPQGRELMATTESDIPVALPEGAVISAPGLQARPVAATPAAAPVTVTASTQATTEPSDPGEVEPQQAEAPQRP